MKNDSFVAFILTHGRPDNVYTYKSLITSGYTGRIVFVVDNEDKTIDQYRKNFGEENVYVFNKEKVSHTFDEADNFKDRRAIVYARNVCFDIAQELGFRYFIELDDDYTSFNYSFSDNLQYDGKIKIKDIDHIFDSMIDCLNSSDQISTIAMAQGGDFIGGESSAFWKKKVARKAMNSFVCDVNKRFQFVGRINEDVNTYTSQASRGLLLFTTALVRLNQKQTQSNSGGMTDIYLDNGTYVKSFYSIIFSPSSVKIGLMGNKDMRLHHHVKWNNTTPKILDESFKKE